MPVGLTEAHHIQPWYVDGDTCLSNCVLLCRHHHALIEPPRDREPYWHLGIRQDGIPEFTPPPELDPDQQPIIHHRFILQGHKPSPVKPPPRQ
ncbi:MAG: HNH endonuclease [Bifidobacteriaceae bacterium]|nr:HNH endonuclease [Bifidobacteriaceae bacterium]